ncbi:MAG: hypothetical protein L3J20_01870 [Flavobacteriaceae bacterium]|nr:hypothetical protein [Flavobacteriaceae bacterium]
MTNDYHRKGRNYELLIKKVFNCKSGRRHGADQSLFIELFETEKTKKVNGFRTSYQRQFFLVKLYIEKALFKVHKKKQYLNSYEHFLPLLIKLRNAKTPDDLAKIVNRSLTKIITLENKLKKRNI